MTFSQNCWEKYSLQYLRLLMRIFKNSWEKYSFVSNSKKWTSLNLYIRPTWEVTSQVGRIYRFSEPKKSSLGPIWELFGRCQMLNISVIGNRNCEFFLWLMRYIENKNWRKVSFFSIVKGPKTQNGPNFLDSPILCIEVGTYWPFEKMLHLT